MSVSKFYFRHVCRSCPSVLHSSLAPLLSTHLLPLPVLLRLHCGSMQSTLPQSVARASKRTQILANIFALFSLLGSSEETLQRGSGKKDGGEWKRGTLAFSNKCCKSIVGALFVQHISRSRKRILYYF